MRYIIGENKATVKDIITTVFTASAKLNRARFLPEYSTNIPPANSVSASGASKGTLESSPGVTAAKVINSKNCSYKT